MEVITSMTNKFITNVNKLKQSKYRKLEKSYMIETKHLIDEAKKNQCLEYIITCDYDYKDDNVIYVSEQIMKKLSNQISYSKYIGVCKIEEIDIDYSKHCLALDNIQDPGNLGSILRNAKAFNVNNIIISDDCVDLYNHKVIQASQGSIFSLNIKRCNLLEEINVLKNNDFKLIGTSLDNALSLELDSKLDSKSALFFGNEGQGIKQDILSKLDYNYKIRMNDFDSLNVACANAIVLYQLFNR